MRPSSFKTEDRARICSSLSAEQKLQLVKVLAQASGVQGMCLGQSLDLISEHKQVNLAELELIHRNKTGALLTAALKLGFICSPHFENKELDGTFLFGFEESIGYLVGTHVRDKDAVVASMIIAEMATTFENNGSLPAGSPVRYETAEQMKARFFRALSKYRDYETVGLVAHRMLIRQFVPNQQIDFCQFVECELKF